jgi:hypothetical protein
MRSISVALVIAGSLLGLVAGIGASPVDGVFPAGIPLSPDWVPREFQFVVSKPARPIDPAEHVQELRVKMDQQARVLEMDPSKYLGLDGSGPPGSAEDVSPLLTLQPPNLWAEIPMPKEPRADLLGALLLGFWVWAVYRVTKRDAAPVGGKG